MNENDKEQQTPIERARFLFGLPCWLTDSLRPTVDCLDSLSRALDEAQEYRQHWYGFFVAWLIDLRIMQGGERAVLFQTERIYDELCLLVGLPSKGCWPLRKITHTGILASTLTIANIRSVMIWRATEVLRLKAEYEKVTGSEPQSRHAHCRLGMLIDDAEREFSQTFSLFVKYGGTETRRWFFAQASTVPLTCQVATV